MNVDKRSFLNLAKRSKLNILNLGCAADEAFGIRVVVLCVARTTFFASSMRFCVAGPASVGSGYISCPRPASSGQVFVLGAAFVAFGHRFVWHGQRWGCVGTFHDRCSILDLFHKHTKINVAMRSKVNVRHAFLVEITAWYSYQRSSFQLLDFCFRMAGAAL